MKNITKFPPIILLLLSACDKGPSPVTASAEIISYDFGYGTPVIGTFYAAYHEGIVTANINLFNQQDKPVRALHLHEGTCEEPGPHWNLGTDISYCDVLDMNGRWNKPYAGDIGNLVVTADEKGSLSIKTNLWTIGTNESTDINGKLIIVHFFPTDFAGECDPSHVPGHTHSNPKLGCGVITIH